MFHRLINGFTTLAFFVLLPGAAVAATYYVRNDGNDSNTGTGSNASQAWQTIGKAVTTPSVILGDIVYVMSGTYNENITPVSIHGVSSFPIQYIADRDGTIFGGHGGEVIVQPSLSGNALNISSADYLEFTGFTLVGVGNHAVRISSSAGINLTQCEIYGATGSGVYLDGTTPRAVLTNCLVRNNSDDGIEVEAGTVDVWQSTIVNNGGDGLDAGNASALVFNSIISSNSRYGISRQSDGDGTVSHFYNQLYSNTLGNFGGTTASTGEIFTDPQFVGSGDYHLRSTSPGRDAGFAIAGTVDDDFHGNPRPENGSWDMGYHEYGSTRGSTPLLLVTQNSGYLTTQERSRKTLFETWDYAVTAIDAIETQANYDAALSTSSLVYVSEQVLSGNIRYKLREATIGVVNEERDLTDEFGISNAWSTTPNANLSIVDGSHYITSPFGVSTATILTNGSQSLSLAGTLAPDLQVLGQWGSSNSLSIVDAGGTLYNSYNSSAIAFGRRVQLPFANNGFDWNWLTENGQTLVQRALEWAASAEIGNSLVGHWKLDETSGTTAADSSGDGNNGTYVNSPTLGVAAPYKFGAEFKAQRYVQVPASAALNKIGENDSNFTVAFWVKPDGLLTGHRVIVQKGSSSSDRAPGVLFNPHDNTIEFVTATTAAGSYESETSSYSLPEGIWTHVVCVKRGDKWQLYLDNQLDKELTLSGTAESNSGDFFIGASPYLDRCEGAVDDVRIYNYALSTSEIAELYGLVGHWKLDESSGSVAIDSSGIENDGTYQGGAAPGGNGPYPGSGANAAEFDGVDGQVIAPHHDAYNPDEAVSIALWVRRGDVGWWDTLVSKGKLGNPPYIFAFTSGGGLTFKSDTTNVIADGSVPENEWTHLVVTYNESKVQFYINGVLDSTKSMSTQLTTDSTLNLNIGSGEFSAGYAEVLLYDVHLYNRVISTQEIAALYGLVGHWKLDETTGITAADSSGSELDGLHTGGVTVNAQGPYPGTGATAGTFDGSNDYVDLPSMSLDFSSGFSAACWVKPDHTPGSGQTQAFLDLSNGADVDEVWVGGVGIVGFQLYMTDTEDGSSLRTIEDNQDLVPSKWTHYVATVDSSGNAKIYRNGELVKSSFTSIPTNVLRTQASLATSPLNDYFPGSLDDVRLYNRPLSPTEIAKLYGLVGHWKFDEGSGSTIADDSLYANNASFNTGSPVWIDGIYGAALEFDGTNDATTGSDFDPPAKGAVSMWIRSDGPPASRQRPWGVGADYEIWQDTDGLISFDIATDGYQGGFITTEPLDTADRWYHLVGLYDSDTDSYEIYINGELHKSGVSTWNIQDQSANLLTFGTRTGSTERFSGAIDDFRVYNRWLSVAEINDLYGRLAYWKLDETSGSVAVDATEHGHDGTYTNGVLLNQTGNIDQAVDFDGSDDYVSVADHSSLQIDNAFSMTAWIRAAASTNIDRMILNKEGEYEVALSSNGELKWAIANTDPGWSWHSTGHLVAIGKWTHVTLTYDNGTISTYANGVLVDTYLGSGTIGDQYTLLNELRLGGRMNNPTGKYFDGKLDDVQLFDRALKLEEIFPIYKGGRPAGIRILKWVEVR